jgi:hypothetical protein
LVPYALKTTMNTLINNQQLYDYLTALSSSLKKCGLEELSEELVFASRQATTTSTEFLGESRIVLKRVLQEGGNTLSELERDELCDVLKQLDKALDRR